MAIRNEWNPPSRKGRSILFVLIPLAFVAILALNYNPRTLNVPIPSFSSTRRFPFTTSTPTSSHSPPAANFHLLIPANKANPKLCKSVLSSVLLGYGIPVLYGWGGPDSMMGKITSFNPYLAALNSTRDEDIVLITDGFDVWFQLPPQVFIDRFHAANQRATDRSRTLYGEKADGEEDGEDDGEDSTSAANYTDEIRQGVILASQKKCWPGKEDEHISCLAAPESSLLPEDVYGPDTDEILNDEKEPYEHVRRRYLNAGFVMGAVKDIRPLWKRATEKAEADMDVFGWDQHVLSEIFGEQEAARHVAAGGEAAGKSGSEAKGMSPFEPKEGVRYEFGVGLDYASELSLPLVFGSTDVGWVTFSNETSVIEAASESNIPPELIGAKELSADLKEQRSGPLAATLDDRFAANIGWEDVPLLTDLYTGVSPALVHFNEWRDNKKKWIETWWEKVWFQPFGRTLLESAMRSSKDVIAVDRNGREFRNIIPLEEGLGVRTLNMEGRIGWIDWNDLCGGDDEQEVLFTDGKGKWAGLADDFAER